MTMLKTIFQSPSGQNPQNIDISRICTTYTHFINKPMRREFLDTIAIKEDEEEKLADQQNGEIEREKNFSKVNQAIGRLSRKFCMN